MLLNTRVCLLLSTKLKVITLELDFHSKDCPTSGPLYKLTLSSSLMAGNIPNVKKTHSWALDLKDILTRRGNPSHFFCVKAH